MGQQETWIEDQQKTASVWSLSRFFFPSGYPSSQASFSFFLRSVLLAQICTFTVLYYVATRAFRACI
jgi:hypothetical protein